MLFKKKKKKNWKVALGGTLGQNLYVQAPSGHCRMSCDIGILLQ